MANIVQKPIERLKTVLSANKAKILEAAGGKIDPGRMVAAVLQVAYHQPALLKCDPLSILSCMVNAATLNLELSGPLGQAWMVPYGAKATFQIGYKGWVTLAFRSDRVADVQARIVHAADGFAYELGSDPRIVHKPNPRDRGDPVTFYALVRYKGGGLNFEVMTVEEVADHRRRYVKNTRADSPWITSPSQMALKTVVKRLMKLSPISVDVQQALAMDEDREPEPYAALPGPDAEDAPQDSGECATPDQLKTLFGLMDTLKIGKAEQDAAAERAGVDSLELLSFDQCEDLIAHYGRIVNKEE
jgi:recombination protein RecT